MNLTIIPTEDEKREWSRMAQAAYSADRNDVGHRFSGAAARIRIGEAMDIFTYDTLMDEYRAWLVFNEFAPIPAAGEIPSNYSHAAGYQN